MKAGKKRFVSAVILVALVCSAYAALPGSETYIPPILVENLDAKTARTNPVFIKAVMNAAVIFVGEVLHVQPHPGFGCGVFSVHQGVKFRLLRTLKGSVKGPEFTFSFLACAPLPEDKFKKGKTLIVFLRKTGGHGPDLESAHFNEVQSKQLEDAISAILSQGDQYTDEDIMPDLLRSIDEKTNTLVEAAVTLRQIGRKAYPALAKLCRHERSEVRVMAARTLLDAAYQDWSMRDILSQANVDHSQDPILVSILTPMLDDKSPEVQAQAAQSLGNIGSGAAKAAPRLARLLRSDVKDVRVQAAWAIEKIRHYEPSMKPHLLAAFSDSDDWVRSVMRRCVGTLRPTPDWAMDRLFKEVVLGDREACDVFDSYIAMGAAAKRAVPQVIDILKSGDQCSQIKATYTLGYIGMGSKSAAEALFSVAQDSGGHLQRGAIDSLAMLGVSDEKLPPILFKMLGSEDSWVQVSAANAVKKLRIEEPNIIGLLEGLLNNHDANVQCAAFEGLRSLEGEKARSAVARFRGKQQDEFERCERIRAYADSH